jgi:hypothetical protein
MNLIAYKLQSKWEKVLTRASSQDYCDLPTFAKWLNSKKSMKLTNTQWDCRWWNVTSYHAIIWLNLFPSYDELAKPL